MAYDQLVAIRGIVRRESGRLSRLVSAHAIYQAVRLVEKELSFALSSESALNVLAAHTKRYAGNGYTLGTHNTLSSLLREARAVTETPDER